MDNFGYKGKVGDNYLYGNTKRDELLRQKLRTSEQQYLDAAGQHDSAYRRLSTLLDTKQAKAEDHEKCNDAKRKMEAAYFAYVAAQDAWKNRAKGN